MRRHPGPSSGHRADAKTAAADRNRQPPASARGDSLGSLWPDVSLTWVEGSNDFDQHCPAMGGHHLMVYTLSGTGRLFQQQGRRELHADFAPGSVMIRPAGSSERIYGSVPDRLRVGVSERLVVEAMAQIGGASTVELVPVLNVNDPLIRCGVSILWAELLQPQHPAQRLLVESVATMLAAHLVRNYDARSRPGDGGACARTLNGPRQLLACRQGGGSTRTCGHASSRRLR
jgi:hypothetical protein